MSMKTSIIKMTCRSIKSFFGRYMAILLIVALSAGFFAGLKITQDAMVNTADIYLKEQSFYDFRLYSTLGFTEEDIEAFKALAGINAVEGMKSVDVLLEQEDGNKAYKIMSLPEEINMPSLVDGRMPETANECLADDEEYTKADIGTVVKVAAANDEAVTGQLSETEYTIVGIVDSPLYIGIERGTTGIGSGSLSGYVYIPEENFTGEVYTEIDITLEENADIYSDEYDELVGKHEEAVTELCSRLAEKHYEDMLDKNGLTPEMAELMGISEPETYVLTRNENAGYVSFESDTAIISGIANIFPIFFIMIAMLVCMTTMTRMVDEERTQIGVLKAMGLGNGRIMGKYLLYAGSATVIGWITGFFLCTWGLPEIFWFAYNAIYDFAPLTYLFSPVLAVVTLAVSMICILGSTFLSCRKELISEPAKLIRPRAAKNGKRILLEKLTPLWKKLSFLQKITLRNMFRYKKRLIMMLVGISCCAALVVTGFGVGDSMSDIADIQYRDVQKYQIEAVFEADSKEAVSSRLDEMQGIEAYITGSSQYVDLLGDEILSSVNMMSFSDTEKLSGFWDFHSGDETIVYPKKGKAIVNIKTAEKLSLSVGDVVEIQTADMDTCSVTISGIFDNYISNYIFISTETYEEAFGSWSENMMLVSVTGDTEAMSEKINELEEINSVIQLESTREAVGAALDSIDYIILLIVLFSGALAFIVIFNLTNINIAERSREIATVQVLGFYNKETESYVLRENLVLSVLASFIGLPLGKLFHRVVMSMVRIDLVAFNVIVEPISYVYAFICTVLFAVIVNLFMKRQIGKIKMAESLKAVE